LSPLESRELTEELPLVFDCAGAQLVGILHRPARPMSVGIVTVIAGGPQYRAGVGRNMVMMARELSAQGIAILRFDHRGLGDSGGEFRGFEHIGEDLQAAVATLRQHVPEVQEVVLWGGCDAASGCMIHAWHVEGVGSMVLGNPWVTTAETQSAVLRRHYIGRLLEGSFWRKLLQGRYDLRAYLRSGVEKVRARLRRHSNSSGSGGSAEDADANPDWIARMREGLRRFKGPVLFLMSGQSIVSREFDDMLNRDRTWQKLYSRPAYKRIDLPDADQTFSGGNSRELVNAALKEWVESLHRDRS
tara:strand:+ start:12934 stop:13839 length:906 start_codon:yes stop_codon:yes gene_type:complete